MTYSSPAWELRRSVEIAASAKQGSPHHWQFSKAHTGPRIEIFNIQYIYDYIGNKQKSYKVMKIQASAV
jgi:hypothetical protein